MRISKDGIQKLKTMSDMVQVVEEHGVTLKKSGTTGLVGLCPFHDENTPSFHVNPDTKTYHCFGCGEGGDIISFIEEKDGFSFMEAVEELAEINNVDLAPFMEENGFVEAEQNKGPHKKDLLKIMDDARDLYAKAYDALPASHAAKREVDGRKVTGMEKYGYGADSVGKILTNKYGKDVLKELGFLSKNGNHHLFSGRLIFPVNDVMGRCVGFSAKQLSEEQFGGKYVNTSTSPLYHKGAKVYGIERARKSKQKVCYITEGQMDVCSIRAVGRDNVVASCGTAITQEQVNSLLRMFDRLIFFLDPDEAGVKATRRMLTLKNVAVSSDAVINTTGKDPNEILCDMGEGELLNILDNTRPLVDTLFSPLLPSDVNTPTKNGENETELLALIGSIADEPVKLAWLRFVRSRFKSSTKPLPTFGGRPQVESIEPNFVSLVAWNPQKVFDAVRGDVEKFSDILGSKSMGVDETIILSGILSDNNFVANLPQYVASDNVYAHISSAIWDLIPSPESFRNTAIMLLNK